MGDVVSDESDRAELLERIVRLEAEAAEHRATIAELRQTRSTMHAVLELTAASVFAKDLEGRYMVVNPKGADLVGRHPDEIIGRTDHELYDQVSADRFRAHDVEVMRRMAPVTSQMPVPTTEGERVYLSIMVPLVDDIGELFGVAGIATDVTERAHAESLLERRTQELTTAQRIARIGSWTWDPRTGEIEISAELSRILSGDPDDHWDIARLFEITHPDDADRAVAALARARTGEQADVVFRISDPMGSGRTRWLHLRTEPTDLDSALLIGTVQEVTDREEAEHERLELEHRLHQTQRLETVGHLAGGVAHDFNNLLAVIGIQAELALRELTINHAAAAHLAELREAVHRAAALTQQLLVFSRHEQHDVRTIDLGVLIGRLSTLLRRSLGDDVELVVDLDPDLAHVKADPSQMEQVFVNLAVNARDAMPDGGRLVVTGRNAVADGEHWLVIDVTDDGTGMSADVAERAFEPFFTTKPPGSGTGLGLTTVGTIVHRSGGRIELRTGSPDPGQTSDARRGTTVEIHLPASDDRVEEVDQGEATAGGTTALVEARTVLVVEDLEALRRLAVTVLTRAGYRTLDAPDGRAGLEVAAREPAIDLLLTDVVMPEMSGGDLVAAMRARHPELPVVFMSGYSAGMLAGRLPPDEHVNMLAKPFTSADLLVAVERALSAATTKPDLAQ